MPDPASACVVLVPIGGPLDPGCDDALRELERRGHPVWRVRGYSAVDAARNQLATDAIGKGFAELMWVDADVAFDPNDVAKLRSHHLPFTCGLYPKKGPRQFAAEFLPGTPSVRFGKSGGLTEIRYCGFGFTHVRRAVFEAVQRHAGLPVCNQRFGSLLVPYFEPTSIPEPGGRWALSEDYAFCERARQAGFPVMADTTIRLWHVGTYRYGWEDAGSSKDRFGDYTFNLPGAAAPAPAAPPPTERLPRDRFTEHVPLWEKLLAPLSGKPIHALQVGATEGQSTAWLMGSVLTHPHATLTRIDTPAAGDQSGPEACFRSNTREFENKLVGHVGRSQDVLRGMTGERFDLAYLGGSREAADVLADAVLAWPLLKAGGLLGFDDYGWTGLPQPERCPALGIDSFLNTMRGRFEALHRGYQVWVRKTR